MNTTTAAVTIAYQSVQIVEEQVVLSLGELCGGADADAALIGELVAHGVLEPTGQGPDTWQFMGPSLALTRRAMRLIQDLGLNAAGVAVVVELLARIDELERRHGR